MPQSRTVITTLIHAFGCILACVFVIPCLASQPITAQQIGVVDLAAAKKTISLASSDDAESRSAGDIIPGTEWIRLKLTLQATHPLDGITVTIFDGQDSTVESFDLSGLANTTIWSKLFSSDQYVVKVKGSAQADGTLVVAAVARSADEPEPLSIIGDDDRTKISDETNPDIRRIARSVVKVFFQDADITRTCSGFFIAKQRIITNHHCLHSQDVCKTATVAINYLDEGIPPPVQQSRCVRFLGADADLDITVLELDANVPADIQSLKLATQSPLHGQALLLPQFPSQQPKLISTIGCKAEGNPVDGYIKDSDFTHRCDTVEGASGSPVLNLAYEVVGLHHLAISDVQFNRAVRIEPIQLWLKSKGLTP